MSKFTELYNDSRHEFYNRSLKEMNGRCRYYVKSTSEELLKPGMAEGRFGHFIIQGSPNRSLNDLKKSFDDVGGCRLVFSRIIRDNQYWVIQLPKTTDGFEADVILLIRFFTKMRMDGIIDNYPCGFSGLEFSVAELIKAEHLY